MEPRLKALFGETLLFGPRHRIANDDPEDKPNIKSEEEIIEISPSDVRLPGKPQFV
jgi:hypothetical protein